MAESAIGDKKTFLDDPSVWHGAIEWSKLVQQLLKKEKENAKMVR